MVKVAQGHEGPPEYDHHALMRAQADKQARYYRNKRNQLALPACSELEALHDSDMGG